jgi:2-polyprenyl-6-methoxyphenol hydroxylase-like FAD-dependent oxidoreductase
MKTLIVGAGIAGPTLAYWLLRAGYEPTLVERAQELRRGGYLIDFWGAGLEVADKMGIVPELMSKSYRVREVRQVDDAGRRKSSFDPELLVRGAGGQYLSIARADLASTAYDSLNGRVETIFDQSVRAIDDNGARVRVTFDNGTSRDFDLVVGADGQHSQVRRLVFGPEEKFEKYLGIQVAAFEVHGYPVRDDLGIAMTYAGVGYQVTRLTMPDDDTLFLITFREDEEMPADRVAQQAKLHSRLNGAGWETPAILESMPRARTFYFDRVSQIRMPSWSSGRTVLIGDAAACVSLLAGQGSALAMVEAYFLAAMLARTKGDHVQAFAQYETALAPFVLSKQKAALGIAAAFAPKSGFQLLLRNSVMRLLSFPFVAKLAIGKSLRDAIDLPPPPGENHAPSSLS